MEYKRYTNKEKKEFIDLFWSIKDKNPEWSLRKHANENDVRYYTARDWYRSKEFNSRLSACYRGSLGPSVLSMKMPTDSSFVFVKDKEE